MISFHYIFMNGTVFFSAKFNCHFISVDIFKKLMEAMNQIEVPLEAGVSYKRIWLPGFFHSPTSYKAKNYCEPPVPLEAGVSYKRIWLPGFFHSPTSYKAKNYCEPPVPLEAGVSCKRIWLPGFFHSPTSYKAKNYCEPP